MFRLNHIKMSDNFVGGCAGIYFSGFFLVIVIREKKKKFVVNKANREVFSP